MVNESKFKNLHSRLIIQSLTITGLKFIKITRYNLNNSGLEKFKHKSDYIVYNRLE